MAPEPRDAGVRGPANAPRFAEVVARKFHDEYEHLAPLYGWETQERSRVEWGDLPENQRKLMVHVVGNLIAMGYVRTEQHV